MLEAGAEEVNDLGDSFEIICRANRPGRGAHRAAGRRYRLRVRRGQLPAVGHACPSTSTAPARCSSWIDALEDSDDVQDVYTNIDIPDDVAAATRRGVAEPRMSTAEVAVNKAAFKRFKDAVNTCDMEFISKAIDELVEPDAAIRTPLPDDAKGRTKLKQMWGDASCRIDPDLHLTVEDLIGEGDKVVARTTVTAALHQRRVHGRAASRQRQIPLRTTRCSSSASPTAEVIETWGVVDVLSQMKQLGVASSLVPLRLYLETFDFSRAAS